MAIIADLRPLPADVPKAPNGWVVVDVSLDGATYDHVNGGKRVIISVSEELDGRRWRHLSMSRRHSIPKWDDLVAAKEAFLGLESKAIQVVPPRSQYVNINPFVLHLFECLDGDILPDFTRGSGSL